MTQIIPSLNFDGTAEAAFDFYKDVFGGEFTSKMYWRDNPQCEQFSDEDKSKIMHVSLPIGSGGIMGNDFVPMSPGQTFQKGNDISITIIPDSREEADRLFGRLSEGGVHAMPMQDMFWGAYFGFVIDKFGIQWMLNVDNAKTA